MIAYRTRHTGRRAARWYALEVVATSLRDTRGRAIDVRPLEALLEHILAEVVDLIPDANPLKPHLRKIEHRSQYATAYRYPVSSSRTKRIPRPPNAGELQSAIDDTAMALARAVAAFAVDLRQADTPAGTTGPIRQG